MYAVPYRDALRCVFGLLIWGRIYETLALEQDTPKQLVELKYPNFRFKFCNVAGFNLKSEEHYKMLRRKRHIKSALDS